MLHLQASLKFDLIANSSAFTGLSTNTKPITRAGIALLKSLMRGKGAWDKSFCICECVTNIFMDHE